MRKKMIILLSSSVLLLLLATWLLLKQYNIHLPWITEHIDLGEIDTQFETLEIQGFLTREEYYEHRGGLDISIVYDENGNEKRPPEIIDLGEVGVFGTTIKIDNMDTDWILDEEKQSDAYYANEEGARPLEDDSTSDNEPEETAPEDDTASENSVSENTHIHEEIPQYKPAVSEYVENSRSVQSLNYIVYAPVNADSDTPILLFLHGIGENGTDYTNYINTFQFTKYLISQSWQPDMIIVAPILTGGSKWTAEKDNLYLLLSEVVANYGGSLSNMYISGFSAGADAISPLAKDINFKGAIFMAGYLGGSGNSIDTTSFLNEWAGKPVYYYRDNLYGSGGYGYQASYVETIAANAPYYNIDFRFEDMNWDHKSAMVDAVFLPNYYMDKKNQYCKNAIEELIY